MPRWLRSRKGYVIALQWLLVGVVTVWGLYRGGWRASPHIFWSLIGLCVMVILALMRMPLSTFYRPAYWTYLFMADTVFIGAAVYCLAGFETDVYLPYFMIILVAALSASVTRSVLIAVAVSGVYTVLMWRHGGESSVLEPSFLIRLPFFIIVAVFTGYMAQGARLHEEAVHASRILTDQVRSLQQLAAGIAHEVRNPLTVISNSLQVLIGRLDGRGDDADAAREALEQVKRVERIVQATLDFARPTAVRTVWLDLNEAVESSLSHTLAGSRSRDVNVVRRLGNPPPFVWADEVLLGQIFGNIVRNAVEAMPRGGDLVLETGIRHVRGREHAFVVIRDGGDGIPPHQVARLFQPFYTTKRQGTGLGLCLARKYAHAHGGELTVKAAPGKGTEARIELPVLGLTPERRKVPAG